MGEEWVVCSVRNGDRCGKIGCDCDGGAGGDGGDENDEIGERDSGSNCNWVERVDWQWTASNVSASVMLLLLLLLLLLWRESVMLLLLLEGRSSIRNAVEDGTVVMSVL